MMCFSPILPTVKRTLDPTPCGQPSAARSIPAPPPRHPPKAPSPRVPGRGAERTSTLRLASAKELPAQRHCHKRWAWPGPAGTSSRRALTHNKVHTGTGCLRSAAGCRASPELEGSVRQPSGKTKRPLVFFSLVPKSSQNLSVFLLKGL